MQKNLLIWHTTFLVVISQSVCDILFLEFLYKHSGTVLLISSALFLFIFNLELN
jgi:hypothetical protein